MATAIAVPTPSITPHLFTSPSHQVKNTREKRSSAKRRLIDHWREAKRRADGAIVLIVLDESVVAFNEDAAVLTETLGMFPIEGQLSGERECVEFKRSHLEMYVRLLSASGYGDIWTLDSAGRLCPTDTDGIGVNQNFFELSACRFVLKGRESQQ